MTGHYRVVATYTRPHPLDPASLEEVLEAAQEHRPSVHIRISQATIDAVKGLDPREYIPLWQQRWDPFGIPVVGDEGVPDDEWRIAVWQIGVDHP